MVLLTPSLLVRLSMSIKKIANASPMRGLAPGTNPVIRTKQYLEQGIILRDSIRIMMINYGKYEEKAHLHDGARKFVAFNFSQLQYKNPNVQILCMKDVTPTPFITFYLENGEKFYVDIEGKSQIQILEYLQKVVGKPRELIEQQTKAVEPNPANFGKNYKRKCICECEGQVECSAFVKVMTPEQRLQSGGKRQNQNPKKYPFGLEES